jgi:hypothetical protein
MFTRGLVVVCLSLAMVSVVQADAFVTITEISADPAAVGPNEYLPGTTLQFGVEISQDTASDISVRLATLNFEESDPALTLVDPFNFDCAAVTGCALYTQFPNYADPPNVTYTGTTDIPGFMFVIPAEGQGSLLIGTGTVVLPDIPETYMLDLVNENVAMDQVTNFGTQIRFGFGTGPGDEISEWFSREHPDGEGVIYGGAKPLTVIPEPATLALLAIGGIATLRRRRNA